VIASTGPESVALRRHLRRPVALVGIGDDGCIGLSSRAVNAITRAQVLVGGERQLGFLPEFHGERVVLKAGLGAVLERVAELAEEQNVAILASGDPLFFGVGAQVVNALGASNVLIIPQPSCMQLAFARVGEKWDDACFLSLHGRPLVGVVTRLRSESKALLMTDSENHPARIAQHLLEYGETEWHATVCENLGGPGEQVRSFTLDELTSLSDVQPLNVLLLRRVADNWRRPSVIPFLNEEAFAKRMPKKGLITKLEVRLLSLARLGLRPDSVVWDVGAGSGSISIEAGLLAPRGRIYAVEVDPEGVSICESNTRAHGADNVLVIHGRAPEALVGLPAPDAVFVGGSKGSMTDIVNMCLDRLSPGGRLVVNAVTLENAAEVYQAIRARSLVPEVTLLQVSRAEPLAHYLRYEALNPIQVFSVEKPGSP
jgi:precorrin-6Y C5,15-methyltransferase (decarboxylating)